MTIPRKSNSRLYFLFLIALILSSLLVWRLFFLQILNKDFLKAQGEARTLRTLPIHAYRGMITDRTGQPLAISTPVQSVWIKPNDLLTNSITRADGTEGAEDGSDLESPREKRKKAKQQASAKNLLASMMKKESAKDPTKDPESDIDSATSNAAGGKELSAEDAALYAKKLNKFSNKIEAVASLLKMDAQVLKDKIIKNADKDFVYIQRHIAPQTGKMIQDLKIKGVYVTNEYRRYYPTGEVSAHLIGFTNIDDVGQEGLEFAYDDWLKGRLGQQRVLKDRMGQGVEGFQFVKAAENGKDLVLSIDIRLQYLAYRELMNALKEFNAKAGSIVMMDAQTNEVLAMANLPSYNPNKRKKEDKSSLRNRAVTDLFEPGSTLKTFSMVNVLKSGLFKPTDMVETGPGTMYLAGKIVKDVHNYGTIDVATVLKKSSNIGITKLTLATPEPSLYNTLYEFGFGQMTGSNFPGESMGRLVYPRKFRPFELATLSFGYSMSVTPIQLANAYATIANGGIKRPVSLLKIDEPEKGERVVAPEVNTEIQKMLAGVAENGGTATRARIPGYTIAGKTGTSKKAIAGGYADKQYIAVFSGYAPADNPKIVAVIVIDEPSGSKYYGGEVAAPVFAKVVGGALRILNVPVSP